MREKSQRISNAMIFKRKKITITLLAAFLPVTAVAFHHSINAPVKNLTLKDAIFLALRYNPSIQNSELSRITQKFDLREAENAFELQYALTGSAMGSRAKSNGGKEAFSQSYSMTPSVSLETDTGTKFNLSMTNPTTGGTSATAYYNPGLTLSVDQPLLKGSNPNVVLASLRNAYNTELQNRINLRSGIITDIVTVINNYRSVISSEQSLKIDKQSLVRAQQTYTSTEKFIKAGQKPRMDLAQAKLSVTTARIAILGDENSLATSKQTLLLDLGLDPDMKIHIPTNVNVPDYKVPNQKHAVAEALKVSPTYQNDLLNLIQDQRALLVARDNARWSLDATASAAWGSGSGRKPNNNFRSIVNGTNTAESVGLKLTVPINDISNQAGIVSARIKLEQDRISTDLERDTVRTNVINQIRNLNIGKLTLDSSIEALDLQKINLENAYKQFKAGKIDSLSVSQQQDTLTTSEQSVLTNQIAYLNDITKFRQLLQTTLKHWNIKLKY